MTCYACSYSYMEPDADYLICGHPDSGSMGEYIKIQPLKHCEWKKFEQHSLRNKNGSLKTNNIEGSMMQ